ncbi:MAG: sugar phosphate isomerase/epimerase [Oscillospiraceae bacterium]|jgi:sugar phosphate isomerase/epimerase|nr:sugar phosphate isomerase/epimerase [Oscillospiraceae bacterium]
MILSTQTERLAEWFGLEEGIRILCEAGFDALDLSLFFMHEDSHALNGAGYRAYAENLKAVAAAYGVAFNQAHAPFASQVEGDAAYNKRTFGHIVRSMEVAAIAGAKQIIVHPFGTRDPAQTQQRNLDFFNALLPYAKAFNIKIALENMWKTNEVTKKIIPSVCSYGKDLAAYYDALDPAHFTVCLDLGHCGLVGSDAPAMIRELGAGRLCALHVHDNDHLRDSHVAPFFGKMDWEGITQALAEIGYTGEFTFEADNYYDLFPRALAKGTARFLHDIGRYLIEQIESRRVAQ